MDSSDERISQRSLVDEDRGSTCEEALNDVGSGTFQWMLAIICGLGNAADAVELLCLSYILPELAKEAEVTGSEEGFLSAAVFVGMLVGGAGGGMLADRIGRKPTFLLSMGVNSVFGALTAVAPNIWIILALRLVGGVGVGASMPTVFTLTSELVPAANRGFFMNIVAAFWMIGSIVTAGLAWAVVPVLGWRWFAFFCSFPAATACLFTALFLPESPRYLLLTGQAPKASRVFGAVHARNRAGIFVYKPKITRVFHIKPITIDTTSVFEKIRILFSPQLRYTVTLLIIVWIALSFGWYGLILWIPQIFVEIGFELDVYMSTLFVQAANLPGNILAILLVDIVGRKRLMASSLAASACACLWFALAKGKVQIVIAASVFNMVSVMSWNTLDCMSTESFPTLVRGTAFGVLAAFGRIGSTVAQVVNGSLVRHSVFLLLIVTMSMLFLGLAAALILPREMKGAKLADTLADLDEVVEVSSDSLSLDDTGLIGRGVGSVASAGGGGSAGGSGY